MKRSGSRAAFSSSTGAALEGGDSFHVEHSPFRPLSTAVGTESWEWGTKEGPRLEVTALGLVGVGSAVTAPTHVERVRGRPSDTPAAIPFFFWRRRPPPTPPSNTPLSPSFSCAPVEPDRDAIKIRRQPAPLPPPTPPRGFVCAIFFGTRMKNHPPQTDSLHVGVGRKGGRGQR